ncbi:fimbrial protein [Erwinia persicina]|uniref:Type 1 fimbrial protein n=1 Tax=Erwinia persicina TaxID=55211 RepID=A0A4U3F2I2_9GAMM|nr:fimbrial protein [Erwinia persicina]MBC3948126.1 type 1 fimbrial protein [Erwinia persicina]MBD8108164.1 type 1 fimbrial protein [Erwinia persicina]MBD8211232.1 type 1 fimbrial protein [Erwinia persicina]MCQ4095904.1 type 1 fimbrial protein [Erwinia persicina]MCQ4102443.1 type 1 fimbrial protein [Erwinia persicina]
MSDKRVIQRSLLAGLTLLSTANILPAHAEAATANTAEAKVEITGEVTAATCTAGWEGTKNIQVNLGKVSSDKLPNTGDIGALKPFSLELTGCEGVNTITVTSSGVADATDPSDYANTATGSPSVGVAVKLLGGPSQNTVLTPDGKTQVDYPVSGEEATLTFMAEMVRTAKTDSEGKTELTSGKLSSVATLYLTYE